MDYKKIFTQCTILALLVIIIFNLFLSISEYKLTLVKYSLVLVIESVPMILIIKNRINISQVRFCFFLNLVVLVTTIYGILSNL